MVNLRDLKDYFSRQEFDRVIIVADAETRVHKNDNGKIISTVPAGGVSIALDPIAQASNCVFIARAKTDEDKQVVDRDSKIEIADMENNYTLKRVFVSGDRFDQYYNGFSNQTLWPLCHVTFERPEFRNEWYEGYKKVNEKFAQAVLEEIKGKTFIWIHDYQLSLVPKLLGRPKKTVVSMFWHTPWPTWEIFRILPQKQEILASLLECDFLAFHRGYQAKNFLETVRREFEARIDDETNRVFYNNKVTTVKNIPLGIDVDVIKSLVDERNEDKLLGKIFGKIVINQDKNNEDNKHKTIKKYFEQYKIIIGVDRLDYTKGLILRLQALDLFLEKYPQYKGKIVYLGIMAPSREAIPAYSILKKEVNNFAKEINEKYKNDGWKPIHLVNEIFTRKEIVNFYRNADLCLVTPRDDGMNLVSKEFIVATATSGNPGMLVLSQFAGSAIDLRAAIIVNPYDVNQLSSAIKKGLEMDVKEKKRRIQEMAETLEEKNVYEWAVEFVGNALSSARENKK